MRVLTKSRCIKPHCQLPKSIHTACTKVLRQDSAFTSYVACVDSEVSAVTVACVKGVASATLHLCQQRGPCQAQSEARKQPPSSPVHARCQLDPCLQASAPASAPHQGQLTDQMRSYLGAPSVTCTKQQSVVAAGKGSETDPGAAELCIVGKPTVHAVCPAYKWGLYQHSMCLNGM